MRGYYIVIEGLEGAGKSTAHNVLVDTLKGFGVKKIISTREPGGTQFSEKLRDILLNVQSEDKEVIHYKAELLTLYAARVQLVETVIKPALADGIWVISDRHDLSTQAYQGGGRKIDPNIIETLRNMTLSDFRPTLTFYLDITPNISLMRTRSRGDLDRIEQESLAFFTRTRARYLELAEVDSSIYTIDATQPLEKVLYAIRKIVTRWFHEEQKN